MIYTVQVGDTLSEIADKHGLTWPDLYARNLRLIREDPRNRRCLRDFGGEGPMHWIFPGQVLQLVVFDNKGGTPEL